ncbi:UPF0489 family protein [Candidatus Peregrinibacteria bacterium]|nr:UPF0489 family protein [Candidatus Peregrinibacteria bacterium]
MKRRDIKYKMMYQAPFYLRGRVGNNAFFFDHRQNPQLYIPDILASSRPELGSEIAFETFDEHGILKSCAGLKHFFRTVHSQTEKPIIIVDNHNHAFYFWHEAREQGLISDASTLVHIDAHKDARVPEKWLFIEDSHDLQSEVGFKNIK